MAYTQTDRRIAISTPLGKDVLLLRGFAGSEAISQLFHFDLDLLSESDSLKFQDIVGKNVTIRMFDPDGNERYWNGIISRFSQGTQDRRLTAYRAQMEPWFWFLTRTADCRIYQNTSVPDIVKKLFGELGFSDYRFRLYGNFEPREYCVQYRETDFNFISRLMEEEGIYYYFEHQDGKHVLVLANDPAAHDPCPGQATARYDFRGGSVRYEDVITGWHYEEEFRPGGWAQTDYNFETPSTSLAVAVNGKNPYEIYEYPGEYRARAEGDRLARIRLQEQATPAMVSQGSGGCRRFSPGYRFTLVDHYRKDLNQPYLLTSVHHVATLGGDYQVGESPNPDLTYRNNFECIPYATPFRPPRLTPQPFVQGCQTAVVVGPAGEEIYTDKYGRVKVQFHWDREGKKNENSSCWIRVSHPWAGQGWGAIAIPRIGQEVVVDFLEGDPDQPIIIGRVYNAEQMPPFGMPGGAVVSGVKSNSTKGGGGYNEISLNDTKGTELINIHAQYDQQKKVEHDERVDVGNDRTEHVGHNETITVDNNRTEKVGVDESITIGNNRTENVGANETITVRGDRKRSVNGSETVTVTLTRTHNVLINEMINILGAQETNVGAVQTLVVGGARLKTVVGKEVIGVGGGQTVGIKGNQTEVVGKNQSTRVAGSRSIAVVQDDGLKVGKKLTINAGDQIVLTTGNSTLTLKKDGTITIKGKKISVDGSNINLKASGKICIKASGDVVVTGSKIKNN